MVWYESESTDRLQGFIRGALAEEQLSVLIPE